MKVQKNILWWDRFVRFILGIVMIAWAIAGGPAWAYIGLYVLATGAWGYCAVYSLLGYQPFEGDL
jgi:hypothetical protein